MSKESVASMIHLSDLHLGKNISDRGDSSKATITGFFKKRRLEMQAHDPFILTALHGSIGMAARAIGAPNDDFDVFVVTGDIVTNASSQERFSFAKKYLTAKVPMTKKHSIGLRISTDKLLCVPGNHDVMIEENPERYLKYFKSFPDAPPYVKEITANNGQKFIFYGIDSNGYGEGNLGVGKASLETIGWLNDEFCKIDATEDEENNIVRILLLHHHPVDLNQFRRTRPILSYLFDYFTVLKGAEQLLDLCKGKIDLIMHGHEHFPIAFQDKNSGCVIISAGTTSEWQPHTNHENTFHTLIFQGRDLKVAQFNWTGGRFRKSNTQNWSFKLPCKKDF